MSKTGALNQAVKRNRQPVSRRTSCSRFTARNRATLLKCQIGISRDRGGRRRSLPYAFTEQGVAMLSSVLRSPRAVQVNIAIMRAFVRLREMLLTNADLARKLAALGGQI